MNSQGLRFYCWVIVVPLLVGCGQGTSVDHGGQAQSKSAEHVSSVEQQRAPGTVLLDVQAADGKIPTSVGHYVPGQGLVSGGAAGQLMFGPYAAVAAGTYRATIYGAFQAGQSDLPLSVDIAYDQGKTVVKRVEVKPSQASGDTLVSFDFSLPVNASDMEVRAAVPAGLHVVIKGYKVIVQ